MTQHTAYNNKMEIRAQHTNSRNTCSHSALSESSRCYQENGTYLPNVHNTAKAEYCNQYAANSLLPLVGTGKAVSTVY
jgi:hypothetical protein